MSPTQRDRTRLVAWLMLKVNFPFGRAQMRGNDFSTLNICGVPLPDLTTAATLPGHELDFRDIVAAIVRGANPS